MSNLDSINNPFNINVFFFKCVYFRNFLQDNIQEHEERNANIKVKERPVIFRFI